MANINIPHNLKLSNYLFKNCKLWVWDFDDTLIDSLTYNKKNMSVSSIRTRTNNELNIEVPQWKYFKELCEFLVMSGHYVAIASFGTYEIIKSYLDRIMGFNQQIFSKRNILAPTQDSRNTRNFTFPPDKNQYIYQLMQIYRVQDFQRVVLFDDLASNISNASAIGVIAVQINSPNNGDNSNLYFGPWVMDTFDNKIKNNCGNDIYLNRPFTGITSLKSKGNDNESTKLSYSGNSYDKVDFGLGITEIKTLPAAFGTGIGSRKITRKPEYKWNKTNVSNPPNWNNGNWDTSDSQNNIENYKNNKTKELFVDIPVIKNNTCTSCKTIEWDYTTITLTIIIVFMVMLMFCIIKK